jgi:5-methylcytosine-specific restriction endonuclease McrA
MQSTEAVGREGITISAISDAELLANTRGLIGRSNQVFAALLAHLGEVEARGLHRTRACSSLYAYCLYELRLSEDAAVRRVAAARLVRQFPELLEAVASGELHLTGLLMLGPHLTRENHREVLARAKHRTKKELAKLVRVLDPLPAVPARIEALGPAPRGVVATNPSWAEQVASFCPVRELVPGDRPRDWVEDGDDGTEVPKVPGVPELPAPARITEPLRYKVQFTATEEHVNLLERAAALLSHSEEPNGIEAIHLRALRELVERLEKRRFGALKAKPAVPTPSPPSKPSKRTPRRSRHIPARVRRAVFERDEARCTYVDATRQRCRETHHLEFHHLVPFARGGQHRPENLTLRCTEHNALAAELDFGRQRIDEQRAGSTCESARQAVRGNDICPRQRG